jgi:hypothetical protein
MALAVAALGGCGGGVTPRRILHWFAFDLALALLKFDVFNGVGAGT